MADEKTIIMPDGQNNNGLGNLWPLAFMGNGRYFPWSFKMPSMSRQRFS